MGRIEKLIRYAVDPAAEVGEARNAWLLALTEIRRAGLDPAGLALELGADDDAARLREELDAARARADDAEHRLAAQTDAHAGHVAAARAEIAALKDRLAAATAPPAAPPPPRWLAWASAVAARPGFAGAATTTAVLTLLSAVVVTVVLGWPDDRLAAPDGPARAAVPADSEPPPAVAPAKPATAVTDPAQGPTYKGPRFSDLPAWVTEAERHNLNQSFESAGRRPFDAGGADR